MSAPESPRLSAAPISDQHLKIASEYFYSFLDPGQIDVQDCITAADRMVEWRTPFTAQIEQAKNQLVNTKLLYDDTPPEREVAVFTTLHDCRHAAWIVGMRAVVFSGSLTDATRDYIVDTAAVFNITNKQLYSVIRPSVKEFEHANIQNIQRSTVRHMGRQVVAKLQLANRLQLTYMKWDDKSRRN